MATVKPEFPTGNGKVDLLISLNQKLYGIEVKSFANIRKLLDGMKQAARYAHQMKLTEICLAVFTEYIDNDNRKKYEVEYLDAETSVKVMPLFIPITEMP
jgi:hypothetical protein